MVGDGSLSERVGGASQMAMPVTRLLDPAYVGTMNKFLARLEQGTSLPLFFHGLYHNPQDDDAMVLFHGGFNGMGDDRFFGGEIFDAYGRAEVHTITKDEQNLAFMKAYHRDLTPKDTIAYDFTRIDSLWLGTWRSVDKKRTGGAALWIDDIPDMRQLHLALRTREGVSPR